MTLRPRSAACAVQTRLGSVVVSRQYGRWDRVGLNVWEWVAFWQSASGQGCVQSDVRLSAAEQPARSVSGGNQEPVLFARAVAQEPAARSLNDPRRGVRSWEQAGRRHGTSHICCYVLAGVRAPQRGHWTVPSLP